jgi:MFS family permease
MGRIRATIFTLISGGITALVLWMLPQSEGDGLTISYATALFFGGCTLVFVSYLVPARIPPEELDGAIIVPNSFLRSLIMALALISITAGALVFMPVIANDDDWRKYAFYIIPAPCAFLAFQYLRAGLGGRPAFRFDRDGVTRYQWGERTTPWSAVTNVRILTVRGAENVVLDVTPEFRRQFKWWQRLNGSTGFGDVTLPSGASGLPPRDIEALANRFWRERR